MSFFRAFLLWALMVAVPFQAYAAASMLRCAPGASTAGQLADAGMRHIADTRRVSEADHAVHAVRAGHADHAHAAHRQHSPSVDADAHDRDGTTSTHDEDGHACGTCGACHAVALIGVLPPMAAVMRTPADLGEPAPRVATRTPRVPDKPPRG
jgi:hypothetical protein